jgi:hypothetical protein
VAARGKRREEEEEGMWLEDAAASSGLGFCCCIVRVDSEDLPKSMTCCCCMSSSSASSSFETRSSTNWFGSSGVGVVVPFEVEDERALPNASSLAGSEEDVVEANDKDDHPPTSAGGRGDVGVSADEEDESLLQADAAAGANIGDGLAAAAVLDAVGGVGEGDEVVDGARRQRVSWFGGEDENEDGRKEHDSANL